MLHFIICTLISSTVPDSAELAVYTWYMTIENYQEMRRNDITNVMIPLFKDSYQLPIYATLFNPYSKNIRCYFQTPSDSNKGSRTLMKHQVLGRYTYKFTAHVTSTQDASGVYNITCPVHSGGSSEYSVSKALNVTFISGTMHTVASN